MCMDRSVESFNFSIYNPSYLIFYTNWKNINDGGKDYLYTFTPYLTRFEPRLSVKTVFSCMVFPL